MVTIPFNWINKVGNNIGNKVGNKKSSLTDNRKIKINFVAENKKSAFALIVLNGDSLGARTPDLLIKSQVGIIQKMTYL